MFLVANKVYFHCIKTLLNNVEEKTKSYDLLATLANKKYSFSLFCLTQIFDAGQYFLNVCSVKHRVKK